MLETTTIPVNSSIIPQKNSGTQQTGGWTKHAPPGGITINGKFYKGGRFIPNDELSKASPEEKKELEDKINNHGNIIHKKEGEELEQENNNLAQEENPPQKQIIQEPFYIFDNGKLIDKEQTIGYFILRNNPVPQPVVFSRELRIFAALNTYRFDIIISSQQKVVSLISESRHWPESREFYDIDIFPSLLTLKTLTIQEIPLSTYTILDNLSPGAKESLSSS